MWLLVRLSVALLWLLIMLMTGQEAGHPAFLSPLAAVLVVGVAAGLSWLATRQWREDLMLANLGTPPWITLGLLGLPPLVLEVIVAQLGSW